MSRINSRVCLSARFGHGFAIGVLLVAAVLRSASARGTDPAHPGQSGNPPYPVSSFFHSLTWEWDTLANAAPGSDLWPVTWGEDNQLYTAWGDGGGFGGTDRQGRVSAGFGRIEGTPTNFHGYNVNGGEAPENPAFLPGKGKVSGMVSVDGVLYANLNLQDGTWPDIHHAFAVSTNHGAAWNRLDWQFERGPGKFQPTKFIQFGRDYSGVPEALAGYVYLVGFKQPAAGEMAIDAYLARFPRTKLRLQNALEFLHSAAPDAGPQWTREFSESRPCFTDPNGGPLGSITYLSAFHRYLATTFHSGPGQLGVFDSPNPWGPWTTVAYYGNWGGMGTDGEGLSCEFPAKWMSSDGMTLWSVFSVYGDGGKKGIQAHDRFNLIRVQLGLQSQESRR